MYLLNNLFYLIILLGITLPAQQLGEMTIYNTDNSGLTYNQINCIEFDGENRLWAGTEDGVSVFNEFNNTEISNFKIPQIIRQKNGQPAGEILFRMEW